MQAVNTSFSRKMIFVIGIVVIAFIIGLNFSSVSEKVNEEINYEFEPISNDGFVPVEIKTNATTVFLSNECHSVFFDITDDQAYSVARGLEGVIGPRPLTHDIMKDILDNFGIEVTNIRIDRYDNELYYATIYMKQGNKILELDARPSDSIALSVRTGIPLYFKESILQKQGVYTCQNR